MSAIVSGRGYGMERFFGTFVTRFLVIGLLAISTPILAGEVHEIDQIMDMDATTPEDFYRFEPNYYWIKLGDTIRFNNTTGNHTVKSVEGIWPEGVEMVDISNQSHSDIALTQPGVYGFRCKVHSRHGMFALIIVGTPEPNLAQIDLHKLNDRGEKVFAGLLERLEIDRKARQE